MVYELEQSFCAGNDEPGGASAMKHHSLPIKMTLPWNPPFYREKTEARGYKSE